MRVVLSWFVAASWVSCGNVPDPFECLDVPLEACDLTPGCRLSVAHRARIDEASGFSCWEGGVVPVACQPAFDEDRCPRDRVPATGPSVDACLLFDDVCTPEDWVACDPPASEFCPLCETLELGPFVPASLRLLGMEGLGQRLAWGDLNDDGEPDLVATGRDGVLIFFGPLGEESPTLRMSVGDRQVDEEIFVAVGDLDGDGVADLVVGAPRATRIVGTARHGQVAWHRGPLEPGERSLLESGDLRVEGQASGRELGAGLWIADVTGDGALDLLVSERGDDTVARRGGSVRIIPGPLEPGGGRLVQELATVRVAGTGFFGEALLVRPATEEAPASLVGELPEGRVIEIPLLDGFSELTPEEGLVLGRVRDLEGPGTIRRLAWGDLGEGGVPWIVAGLPDEAGVFEAAGRVALFGPRGEASETPSPLLQGRGRCDGDRLGTAIAVGDLDGDGVDDLVLGTERGANLGGLWIRGPLAPDDEVQRWSDSAPRLGTAGWGHDVLLKDVDGDGKLDVVAGAPSRDAVLVFRGADLR